MKLPHLVSLNVWLTSYLSTGILASSLATCMGLDGTCAFAMGVQGQDSLRQRRRGDADTGTNVGQLVR